MAASSPRPIRQSVYALPNVVAPAKPDPLTWARRWLLDDGPPVNVDVRRRGDAAPKHSIRVGGGKCQDRCKGYQSGAEQHNEAHGHSSEIGGSCSGVGSSATLARKIQIKIGTHKGNRKNLSQPERARKRVVTASCPEQGIACACKAAIPSRERVPFMRRAALRWVRCERNQSSQILLWDG